MKVLFVGALSEIACSTFYLKALRIMGHSVVTYDPKAWETTGLLERTALRLRKAPIPSTVERIRKELVRLCHEQSFDCIFVIAENFLPDVFDEIREIRKPAPKFLYHSHDNNYSEGIKKPSGFFEILKKYDALFTTKSQNVARYKKLGNPNSYFIPSAFEPSVHRPCNTLKVPEIDVGFIGTFDRSREKFLDALGWDHLYIWGDNWTRYKGFKNHRDHITPHAVYADEYASIVTHSKLSLGLLREEAEDRHTQRTFEIPACGSLQLAPRNEEILSFFKEDKEIVCFGSPEELKEKVEYYLRHADKIRQIAKAGHERCLSDGHTYLDRVRTMLETTFK